MNPRSYDALILDLDGTLVGHHGQIHPTTQAAILRAQRAGVHVMIATGRSELSTRPVLRELGLLEPAVVYNGAAIFCPRKDTLIEEKNLGADLCERVLTIAEEKEYLSVVMFAGMKHALAPRNAEEELALHDMHELLLVKPEELRVPRTIRITLMSDRHPTSQKFADELAGHVDGNAYLTHFPLNVLPAYTKSRMLVLDIQAQCRGKAEALEFLEQHYGIASGRVVAVGDAGNDLPMLAAAGLGVAMGNAEPQTKSIADRVIGDCDSDTIAHLIEELFFSGE